MFPKIIEKKLKEPSYPYLLVNRKRFSSAIKNELLKNRKFIYVNGISGYGKTLAVKNFLENEKKNPVFWYCIDEWDKDPVTFLNYLFRTFKKKFSDFPESFEEYFSQPLNSENIIKSFIGELSNHLEARLNKESYLVLDNFQEIQNEPVILKIMSFLFNFCPENLKIFIISALPVPESFYPFVLKNIFSEINPDFLHLDQNEGKDILSSLKINNQDFLNELIRVSNKCISIFVLLAQNISDSPELLNVYSENSIYKNSIRKIILQIYEGLSYEIQEFILQTILLPKISKDLLIPLYSSGKTESVFAVLEKNEIIYKDTEKEEFLYNQIFIPVFEEMILSLSREKKEVILDNIASIFSERNPENFLQILLKSKLYDKTIDFLTRHYEYYFRNYLYETLSKIINELEKNFVSHPLLIYLDIRLKRSTGQISHTINKLKQIDPNNKTSLMLLEEGICDAFTGHFKDAIEKLKKLEENNVFELNENILLINSLGISYLHNHDLELALKYFNKAVSLKNDVFYRHDLIKIYHNLGLTYTWMGEFSKAVESYEQSIYISRELKVIPLAMTHNNLSIIYNLQGDFQKAYNLCIQGLEIVRKLRNNIDEIHLYLTLTEAFRGLNNQFKAEECIKKLEELLSHTPNAILDALLLKQKAYYSLDSGNYPEAREFMLKAIHIRKLSEGDPSLLEYKLELAIIDFSEGNYEEALKILSSIEDDVKKGKHKYHLARIYLYSTLCYSYLRNNEQYMYYKKLSEEIIGSYDYKLLSKKLNFEKTEKIELSEYKQLKITTFGDIEVFLDEKSITKKDWSGKKTKLLLIYLLLNKSGVTKEQIIQALFPEGDQSRSALHVLINRLRKALSGLWDDETIDIIQFSDELYKFNFSINYWWDAERFEYLLKSARATDNYDLFEKALLLYKNHFMNGLEIEDWIFTSQEYYRRLAYKAFEDLCNIHNLNKNYDKLLEISSSFFRIDNCFESACENKMKALVALNRKSEAIKQYDILVNSMDKMLNDKPSRKMQEYKEKLFD